jgi:DNA-binding transcriptional LysR family regulator
VQPVGSQIEVETLEAALGLAARGLGGTVALRTVTEAASFPDTLRTVRFDPPLYETFAFVQRTGTKLSPATRELVRLTEQQIARFGKPLRPPVDPGGARADASAST